MCFAQKRSVAPELCRVFEMVQREGHLGRQESGDWMGLYWEQGITEAVTRMESDALEQEVDCLEALQKRLYPESLHGYLQTDLRSGMRSALAKIE